VNGDNLYGELYGGYTYKVGMGGGGEVHFPALHLAVYVLATRLKLLRSLNL
jgi:hypothetical protein